MAGLVLMAAKVTPVTRCVSLFLWIIDSCRASPLTGVCAFYRVLMDILELLENLVLKGVWEKRYLIN